MIEVVLLGAPRILRDGKPVHVDTRKAIALVAYLALTGRPQSRDVLAALLWPESGQQRARATLRRTMSALPDGVLVTDRDTVTLANVRVDVLEARKRLAGANAHDVDALEEVAALARGDLLEGFALKDSETFDEWHAREREAWRRELSGALDRLVAALSDRKEIDRALGHAQAWLALDPLHEAAHRSVMRLHAARSDRAAAMLQYRQCVAVLDRELGVAPLAATTELYEAIARREDALETPETAEPSHAPPPELPLVGRDAELAVLERALAAARRDGHLVAIEGEAGVGKTRLAQEIATRARGPVLWARAWADEQSIPYALAAEALRNAGSISRASDGARAEGSRIAPALAPGSRHEPLDSPGALARFHDAVAELLATACSGGALVLDDMQWADDPSLAVIGHLARRLGGRPILIVLVWRTEEVGARHALRRTLADVRRDGLATSIRPQRLGEQDVAILARAVDPAPGFAKRIWDETEGLPLFVVEYLSAGDAGALDELVATRVAGVSGVAAQVLSAAAVLGRRFALETVTATAGRSDEEAADALDELIARGILEASGDAYDFKHDKIRAFVYEHTTAARRRLLHRRAADALARTAAPAAVARHHVAGGNDEAAATWFARAGDAARALYANAEAIAHYEAALAAGHPDAGTVHEAIGDLRTLLGEYARALTAYETAAALGSPSARIERKIGAVHLRAGAWDLATVHLEQAASDAPAQVLADLSLAAHRAGRRDDARELAQRALETATDDASLAQGHNIAGIVAGRGKRALEHLERSLAIASTLDDPAARAAALNNLALAVHASGDGERALALALEALEICDRIGDRHRAAAVHSNVGDILYASGRRDEAKPHQLEAAAIFAEIGGTASPEIWKLVEW